MKEIFQCKKCQSVKLSIYPKGPHYGLYCDTCGAWIQWIAKKDVLNVKNYLAYRRKEGIPEYVNAEDLGYMKKDGVSSKNETVERKVG